MKPLMVVEPDERLAAFIQHNYKPYSKMQSFGRSLCLLAVGMICCFFGGMSYVWICINSAVFTSYIISVIINNKNNKCSMNQRFLEDGVFSLTMAIELMLFSYNVFTFESGENILLLLLMLFLLALCIVLFRINIHINIVKDRYNKSQEPKLFSAFIILAAAGVLFGRVFLQDLSQQAALSSVAVTLFILSLLMSSGSLNLLKIRYKKMLDT